MIAPMMALYLVLIVVEQLEPRMTLHIHGSEGGSALGSDDCSALALGSDGVSAVMLR
jgi:hypothetical protein